MGIYDTDGSSVRGAFFDVMREKGYIEDSGDMRVYAFTKRRRLCDIVVLFDTVKREIDMFLAPSALIRGEVDVMELQKDVAMMNADLDYFIGLSGYSLSVMKQE